MTRDIHTWICCSHTWWYSPESHTWLQSGAQKCYILLWHQGFHMNPYLRTWYMGWNQGLNYGLTLAEQTLRHWVLLGLWNIFLPHAFPFYFLHCCFCNEWLRPFTGLSMLLTHFSCYAHQSHTSGWSVHTLGLSAHWSLLPLVMVLTYMCFFVVLTKEL